MARLAALAGPPPARFLELGVGTGRLAVPLAAMGYDVTGLDASPTMLDRLRAKDGGTAVHAVLGDMAGPLPAGPFDVVFVAVNTFFGLETEPAQRDCLGQVSSRLVAGGVLVIEAFVPDTARPEQWVDVRTLTADAVVLSVGRTEPGTQVAEGQFVELRHGGPVQLRPWRIRWATPDQLDAMAGDAGLRLAERHAGWEGGRFDGDSTAHVSVYRQA